MSIEAMKQAIEAWDACGRYPDATSDIERLDVAINALRAAIQQAEAQQHATGEPTPQDVVDAFEKARAGSGKPVGILRGVRAVMRLLPDLKPAPDPIAPATGEPVAWPLRARVWKRESAQEWVLEIAGTLGDTDMNIRHTQPLSVAYENVPGLPAFYTHPAPSVPEFSRTAKRKLDELQKQGFAITGYAIQRGTQRGFITNGGFVGWWRSDEAQSVPDDVGLTIHELREIQRAVDDFSDCGETDVPDRILMRGVMAGYLECTNYMVLDRDGLRDAIDAAMLAAKTGGRG